MTAAIGTAGGARDINEIHVGTAAGVKAVTEGWVGTASGPRQFYSAVTTPPPPPPNPLFASISPTSQVWIMVTPGAAYISSEFSASASGGDGSYGYAWETDSLSVSFYNQTGASTALASYDGYTAQVRCLVTDGDGQSIYTEWATIT